MAERSISKMGTKKKTEKEKPLEKMTAKELRELAKNIPEIVGASGMNKAELISDIKKSKGIVEDVAKNKSGTAREIKQKIRVLRVAREKAADAKDDKMALVYRKRLNRLKKKSRRVAA
jgi:hypothetical protein